MLSQSIKGFNQDKVDRNKNTLSFKPNSLKQITKMVYRRTKDLDRNMLQSNMSQLQLLSSTNMYIYDEKSYLINHVVKKMNALIFHKQQQKNMNTFSFHKNKQQYIKKQIDKHKSSQKSNSSELNIYLDNISQGKYKVFEQNCLCCVNQTYQGFQYPYYHQIYTSFQYDPHKLKQNTLNSFCAIVNSGGGFIIIHATHLKFYNQQLEQLKRFLINTIDKNIIWSDVKYTIQFIKQVKVPYLTYTQTPQDQYDIKITIANIQPKKIYYITKEALEQETDSEIYVIKFDDNNKQFRVYPVNLQHFYTIVHQKFSVKYNRFRKCYKAECQLKFYINKFKIQPKYILDLNEKIQFIYKCSIIILISRSKAPATIKQICKVFSLNKYQFLMKRPFYYYNKRCKSAIYFVTIDAEFNIILQLLKHKKQTKDIQNDYVILNPTKFIQIPLSNDPKSNQYNKKQALLEQFLLQIQKCGFQDKIYHSEIKQALHPSISQKIKYISYFIQVTNTEIAIQIFIILCKIQLNGYFIKQQDHHK